MSDRRFDFSNARVKAPGQEQPSGAKVQTPKARVITWPVVDLLAQPGGARDRQLLYNDVVEVLEVFEGFAFARAMSSGYVGYVETEAVTTRPVQAIPDHRVISRLTHAYAEPDIKSKERMALSLGTQLSNLDSQSDMTKTEAGWVPSGHLSSTVENDPVAVAERLLGAPYLWGGNSANGIDCSGLVWIAFSMCGVSMMPDSDLQKAHDGALVENGSVLRGDVWFWDGHVAIVVDQNMLLHANAHHMAVVHEDLEQALARIGPTTARKRITLPSG